MIKHTHDATANDSDKTFTVPNGVTWRPLGVTVTYASTGTAGDRQVGIDFCDSSDNAICSMRAGATQGTSTTVVYVFGVGNPREITAVDQVLMTPIPFFVLLPGYYIRVFDTAAIAAAADDMTVDLLLNVRDVGRESFN